MSYLIFTVESCQTGRNKYSSSVVPDRGLLIAVSITTSKCEVFICTSIVFSGAETFVYPQHIISLPGENEKKRREIECRRAFRLSMVVWLHM